MAVWVEFIATPDCTGRLPGLPEVVQRFAAETGGAIESRIYDPWEATDEAPSAPVSPRHCSSTTTPSAS